MQDTSVGVYKIPCTDNDLAYIGQTGKWLRIRFKQLESNCRHNSNPSAVVNHHKLGHSIDFARKSYEKRKIAESLLRSVHSRPHCGRRIAADTCGRHIVVISVITRQIGRMRPTVRPTRGRRIMPFIVGRNASAGMLPTMNRPLISQQQQRHGR